MKQVASASPAAAAGHICRGRQSDRARLGAELTRRDFDRIAPFFFSFFFSLNNKYPGKVIRKKFYGFSAPLGRSHGMAIFPK